MLVDAYQVVVEADLLAPEQMRKRWVEMSRQLKLKVEVGLFQEALDILVDIGETEFDTVLGVGNTGLMAGRWHVKLSLLGLHVREG